MKKLPAILLLSLMVSGCAQQSFRVNNDVTIDPKETKTAHFFVSGLGQTETIDAAKVCGGADKVVKTEVQQTFLNGFLSVITLGIYTPREARVYCAI